MINLLELDEIITKYDYKIKFLELKLRSYDEKIFLEYKNHKFPYKVILLANDKTSIDMNDEGPELREFLKVVKIYDKNTKPFVHVKSMN